MTDIAKKGDFTPTPKLTYCECERPIEVSGWCASCELMLPTGSQSAWNLPVTKVQVREARIEPKAAVIDSKALKKRERDRQRQANKRAAGRQVATELIFRRHNGPQPWTCHWCEGPVYLQTLTVHHVDGDHANGEPRNLAAAHEKCHEAEHRAEERGFQRARQRPDWDTSVDVEAFL